MRKESQSKVTMTGREFGPEDPELHLPNKPQIPNSNPAAKRFWDLITGVLWDLGFQT
jgi:hypothetical protein